MMYTRLIVIRALLLTFCLVVLADARLLGQTGSECLTSPSTSVVAGTVISDSTGHPIIGGQVIVVGTRCGSLTDSAGHYTIGGIDTGPHVVRAEFIGFASQRRELVFGQADSIQADFRLKPSRVILGCDHELMDTAPDLIPAGPIPEKWALMFTGLPIEGWGCVRKSHRRRIASDAATVAFYADLLSGKRTTPSYTYEPSLLYWLAVSGDPQYMPVLLEYSDPALLKASRADRDNFLSALEGLIRHASRDPRALDRLEFLSGQDLGRLPGSYVFRGLVRVNNKRTRVLLSEMLESDDLNDYRRELIENVVAAEPCSPGTLMGWGHQVDECSIPDP